MDQGPSGPPPPYPGGYGSGDAPGYPPGPPPPVAKMPPGQMPPAQMQPGPPPAAQYGQPPYGQPMPPPYGQPGQPPYGTPQMQPPYGQPMQPAYAPQTNASTTVVVTQPALTMVQTFRESPTRCRCPHCQADIITATQFETGTLTWIVCLVLCIFGCDFGCCLIPFCVDSCKDVIHTCPNCRQQIARWNRM